MNVKANLYSATGNLLWFIEDNNLSDAKVQDYANAAKRLCQNARADGFMLMDHSTHQLWIINADGSNGSFCGNGLRVAAFYLQETQGFRHAKLMMGHTAIEATMDGALISVYLDVPKAGVREGEHQSYNVNVPNPHMVIVNPPKEWSIEKEGGDFCKRYNTNVEFVYPEGTHFSVLVYERGVGITKACGSGAIAVFKVLKELGLIDHRLDIKMIGGDLTVRESGDRLCLSGEVIFLESENI